MKELPAIIIMILWGIILLAPFFLIGMWNATVGAILFVLAIGPLFAIWLFWGAAIVHIIFMDNK